MVAGSPHGWSNVTRFTALTVAKLSALERRVGRGGAASLGRALCNLERRRLQEGFGALRQHSNRATYALARGQVEDMLHKLQGLVDGFYVDVDDAVDIIVHSTLNDAESPSYRK